MQWKPINPEPVKAREGMCLGGGAQGPTISVTRDTDGRWWCHSLLSGGVFSDEQNMETLKLVAMKHAEKQLDSALAIVRDTIAETLLATADNIGVPVADSDAAAREV